MSELKSTAEISDTLSIEASLLHLIREYSVKHQHFVNRSLTCPGPIFTSLDGPARALIPHSGIYAISVFKDFERRC